MCYFNENIKSEHLRYAHEFDVKFNIKQRNGDKKTIQ